MKTCEQYTLPVSPQTLHLPFREAYNRSSFNSYQSLSAATGIPDYTLSRILSGQAKDPGLYNLAKIAKVLNPDLGYNFLSLDAILGVTDTAAGRCPEHRELEKQLCQLRAENIRLRQRGSRRLLHGLVVAVLLLCALVFYLVVDASNPQWGFFGL